MTGSYGSRATRACGLSRISDHEILAMWPACHDTSDIARAVGVPESEIANRLPRILDDRRRADDFENVSHETSEPFRLHAASTA